MDKELLDKLLLSIEGSRLSVICGAGLSMAPPTELPSAAVLARQCNEKYKSVTGSDLPDECDGDLEAIAEHMIALNRFRDLLGFIRWEKFQRLPNEGHTAIADLLVCGAFRSAISTNYDSHIEDAAYEVGEHAFAAALDGLEANRRGPDRHEPLLKLHGCYRRDLINTVWASSQIETNEIIKERIDTSARWLLGDLAGRDIIVVGFWSDWSYLNNVLETAVASSEPRTVVLVDPADSDVLSEKAAELWTWASSAEVEFVHVRESGSAFLAELRAAFSRNFLNSTLARGFDTAVGLFSLEGGGAYQLPEETSMDVLFGMRKDLSGCSSQTALRDFRPSVDMDLPAAFINAFVHKGAVFEGTLLHIDASSVRVLNTPNRRLSEVRESFAGDFGPDFVCEVVVCVGGVDDVVPSHLIREADEPSVVRGGWNGDWLTGEGARARFDL